MMHKDNRTPINRSLLAMAAVQLMPFGSICPTGWRTPQYPVYHV